MSEPEVEELEPEFEFEPPAVVWKAAVEEGATVVGLAFVVVAGAGAFLVDVVGAGAGACLEDVVGAGAGAGVDAFC